MPLFGHVNLGPYILLQLAKQKNSFCLPRQESYALDNLRAFCIKFNSCQALERLENEDSFENLNVKDQVKRLKSAVDQIEEAYRIETAHVTWMTKGRSPADLQYKKNLKNAHIKCITDCKEII